MLEQVKTKHYYKNRDADEKQAELYKKFPATHFLGNEKNADHFFQWVTFFRRNFNRFAEDYLGIPLHKYQSIWIYLMGINYFFVVVASRAAAKSFLIALYSVIKCILYPNSKVVIASGTKKQAKLIVSEKIQKELCGMSPSLRKEIRAIKDNQNETIVEFNNNSTITVVAANDNSRGYRSTVIVREEFRQIKKYIDDSVLSQFQIVRQVPCLKLDYYKDIEELKEQNVDIFISSSWFDNGTNWMWSIVDQAYNDMMAGKKKCLLAFDESIPLREGIKTQEFFQTEKKKQDPTTWALEVLNQRLKANTSAFFTYDLLEQNQVNKKPWYPRKVDDVRTGKRNRFDISKQKGEVRIISCDMAFVENKANDNSVFSCMRFLPETKTYERESGAIDINGGFRRIVPYMEHIQGGDIVKQSRRIRQLFNDFQADYIVLDTRNAGIAVYDLLAKVMYDDERDIEYSPLKCMNDENIANRIRAEGAEARIYAVNASQKLNSDIAQDFRRVLGERKIDFLIDFNKAKDDVLQNIDEYANAPDADTQIFFERPFLETQELIFETSNLLYDRKEQSGVIVIREAGKARKDRYTSVSYGSYFATQLEKDLAVNMEDYEYSVFVN